MFNASRLTLARKRRGLTKTKLAQAVGVDLRTITGYEAGEFLPSEESVDKLAQALAFPGSFFVQDDADEPSPDAVSFRAMSKMTASQRDVALGQGALAFLLNDWLTQTFSLPGLDLPDLGEDQEPEAAAYALRHYWGLGELPISNMVHLLEHKGVRVYSLSVAGDATDAFSLWKESTPFVFLNTQKSAERSRFDAAHELGHLVLHRHASPQGREAEIQADAFASALLMPRRSVVSRAPRFATLNQLIQLKKYWNVSLAALVYRLHALGMISDWHHRTLCIDLSKQGYRKTEPNGSPTRETSQIWPRVLASLREDGQTKADLAAQMHVGAAEIDGLVFGLVTNGLTSSPVGGPASTGRRAPNLTLVQ
ncbi:helix-turn-helix domain-containing protein [Cupriavidus sp. PET2-C1]